MENATLLTWRFNFSIRHQKAFGLCSLGRRTLQHAAVNHVGCPVGSISRVTTHTRDDYPFSLSRNSPNLLMAGLNCVQHIRWMISDYV